MFTCLNQQGEDAWTSVCCPRLAAQLRELQKNCGTLNSMKRGNVMAEKGCRSDAVNELILISKYAGMREDLVQAGGGNTSIKMDDTRMLIKASGIQLANISKNSGYSIVDYAGLKQQMTYLLNGSSAYTADEILKKTLLEGKQPSIETFLHAITGRVTLHTHSAAVNVLAARKGGMGTLKKLFPNAVAVDYATPGLDLAKLYYQAYSNINNTMGGPGALPIVFLKNHGLVVSGDTASQVMETTEDTCKTVEQFIGMNNDGYRKAFEIYSAFCECGLGNEKIVVKAENKIVLETYEKFNFSLWPYQTCPDCVVFCGKQPFCYLGQQNLRDSLDIFLKRFGEPILVQCGRELFIRADSVKKAREIESVLMFSAQVAGYNDGFEMELLSQEEQDFLLNWDAEKYRKGIK